MSVAIAWSGFPAYAARQIKEAGGDFPVLATRPAVPIDGMDELLPGRIHWLQTASDPGLSWKQLGLPVPSLYFQPSWNLPGFNALGDQVRAEGGRVVVMFDNRWRGDLRQCLGAVRFRTQWKGRFSAAWVAGRSGEKLARFWGFTSGDIYQGMYGADPTLFGSGKLPALHRRPRRFVFVGQLIARKGVPELLKAWRSFKANHPEWELHVYGTGPLEAEVRLAPVVFHGFQQPPVVAAAMREARFLVLPSHEEHWGLVVCEAALAGCGLLLSDAVGSADDLQEAGNGMRFRAGSSSAIAQAFQVAARFTSHELDACTVISQAHALRFGPAVWAKTFHQIQKRFGVCPPTFDRQPA